MTFFAHLYVNYIEPWFKVGVFLIIAYLFLQAWFLLRDGKKLGDVVAAAFMLLIKIVTVSLKYTGKGLVFTLVMLQKITKEVVKAISDFFNSKI